MLLSSFQETWCNSRQCPDYRETISVRLILRCMVLVATTGPSSMTPFGPSQQGAKQPRRAIIQNYWGALLLAFSSYVRAQRQLRRDSRRAASEYLYLVIRLTGAQRNREPSDIITGIHAVLYTVITSVTWVQHQLRVRKLFHPVPFSSIELIALC